MVFYYNDKSKITIKGDCMNGFGGWLRRVTANMGRGFRRFMEGRYGTDKLNSAILTFAFILCIVGLFVPVKLINLLIHAAAYVLMFWSIARSLSRNTYKRYQENRKYLQFIDRVKDREHRYFDCPRCRQQVRVPRGKGKLAITCPKCKEKFVKKT